MADWDEPTLASLYADFLSYLKARDVDLAQMFSQGASNVPDKAIKYDEGTNRFLIYDEATAEWNDLLGALAVQHGGTGKATLTAGSLLAGNGTNGVQLVGSSTDNYMVLAGHTSGVPQFRNERVYGIRVSSLGTKQTGSPGWTSQKIGSGNYKVFAPAALNVLSLAASVTPDNATQRFVYIKSQTSTYFEIQISHYDAASGAVTALDTPFQLVAVGGVV